MQIGFLLCDHFSPELAQLDGDGFALFQKCFPELDFKVYPVCDGVFPDDVNDHEVYMVGGSRYSVYDDILWIDQLKAFVRKIYEANKYYVGVCFGHQLLAEALGGKVRKSKTGWCVGIQEIEIIDKKRWMLPSMKTLRLLKMCQDQVQQLPEGSSVLARHPKCQIAMFMVGDKMLGVQGHPEFTRAVDCYLIEYRMDRIGETIAYPALKSLEGQHDGQLFAKWVMNFLFEL